MNKPLLIGVSGKLGSGKDLFASLFATELTNKSIYDYLLNRSLKKYKIYKKSFAYNLKKMVETLTGIDMTLIDSKTFTNPIYDYTREQKDIFLTDYNMTLGQLLQQFGTEIMRNNLNNNVWVNSLFSTHEKYNDNDIWIITDVRFKNEFEAIKNRNGLLIRLQGDPLKLRENSQRDLNHQSETDLDEWEDQFDLIIKNDINDIYNFKNKIKTEVIDQMIEYDLI